MAVPNNLRYFAPSEFQHPFLVNEWCVRQLDSLRGLYGEPLIVTDDARLPTDAPPGSAGSDSLHVKGQAFDLRTRDKTEQQMWKLVGAAYVIAASLPPVTAGIELELVASKTDHHLHIGFFMDGRPSRLFVSAE